MDLQPLTLGHYPTPLEEAARFREALGAGPRILIKRDDLTGPGFGGNKVRKLEYELAQAIASRAEVVITSGGETSNHARVTAALCARLGLECILVLNRTAAEGRTPASLHLDELYGARIVRVETRAERRKTVDTLAASLREEGRRVAVIPLGASTPVGAMGYVRAVEELARQLGGLRPDYMFLSSSSGGTHAGVLAGCSLAGFAETKVVGVSPDDPADSISAVVTGIIEGMESIAGKPLRRDVTVLDGYIGGGYGVPTPAGEEATRLLARTEGAVLDPTYTAKAMAAMIDWIRTGKLKPAETVVFWHTGGQLALFDRAG